MNAKKNAKIKRRKINKLRARLRYCFAMGEATHGSQINIQWLHWFGEWGHAFDKLEDVSPRAARKVTAEAWSRALTSRTTK
jgi:hypothetical protein